MLRVLKKFATTVGLVLSASAAFAAPVTQTITHNYGTGAGKVAPTYGGDCGMTANSVTVRDSLTGGCTNRFSDSFSFTGFDSVDSFTLTLSFSGTANILEDWKVRPGSNAWSANDQAYKNLPWNIFDIALPALLFDMPNSTAATTATFVFNAGNLNGNASGAGTLDDVFSQIVSEGKFQLWFADQGITSNSFTLNSASLTIAGTTASVPEPASLALAGLALCGVAAASRRRKSA